MVYESLETFARIENCLFDYGSIGEKSICSKIINLDREELKSCLKKYDTSISKLIAGEIAELRMRVYGIPHISDHRTGKAEMGKYASGERVNGNPARSTKSGVNVHEKKYNG